MEENKQKQKTIQRKHKAENINKIKTDSLKRINKCISS